MNEPKLVPGERFRGTVHNERVSCAKKEKPIAGKCYPFIRSQISSIAFPNQQ